MTNQIPDLQLLFELWDSFLSTEKSKQNAFFFRSNPLLKFYTKLAIGHTMSVEELKNALEFIENVSVNTQKKSKKTWLNLSPQIRFGEWIKQQEGCIPISDSSTLKKPALLEVEANDEIYNLLFITYNKLATCYVQAKQRAQGLNADKEISYSQEQLRHSAVLEQFESDTRESTTKDQSTAVGDIQRKGVTFEGQEVHSHLYSKDDPLVIEAIEQFSRDSIAQSHSRANKIYNFGGQFIEASILNEFIATMKLADHADEHLMPQLTQGHVNWYRDKGGVYATVVMKIYTCMSDSSEYQCFAIGSDGSTLIGLKDREFEKMNARYFAEKANPSKADIVPIVEVVAKLELVLSEDEGYGLNEGYMIKVKDLTYKINTAALVCTQDPEYDSEREKQFKL